MRNRSKVGISLVELLVVLAVGGILTGIGITLLPRHATAVSQGQRIFGTAIQFARFEAIKRNTPLDAVFEVGAAEVVIRGATAPFTEFRRFPLDPHGRRVVIKAASPESRIVFNSRGVSTTPITRDVTVGIVGLDGYDRSVSISGQGAIRRTE